MKLQSFMASGLAVDCSRTLCSVHATWEAFFVNIVPGTSSFATATKITRGNLMGSVRTTTRCRTRRRMLDTDSSYIVAGTLCHRLLWFPTSSIEIIEYAPGESRSGNPYLSNAARPNLSPILTAQEKIRLPNNSAIIISFI